MKPGQRDYMRYLLRVVGPDPEALIKAYADAERKGIVERKDNTHKIPPEKYARALLLDGLNKGWLGDGDSVPMVLDN